MGSKAGEVIEANSQLVLEVGGREVRARPGERGLELEAWLSSGGHETFVFVLEREAGKKVRIRERLPRRFEKEAGDDERHAGEVRLPDGESLRGWLFPGGTRKRGRALAGGLKTQTFLWARVGDPIEVHSASDPEDSFFELGSSEALVSRTNGYRDMARSFMDLADRPTAFVDVVGGRIGHLYLHFLAMVALAIGGGLWLSTLMPEDQGPLAGAGEGVELAPGADLEAPVPGVVSRGDPETAPGEDDDGHLGVARRVVNPGLLPALLVGWCLWRRRSSHLAGEERTAAETESAWRLFAPELAAAWLLAGMGVILIAGVRAQVLGSPGLELAEDVGHGLVICLWLLPAIVCARDVEDLFGGVVSGLVSAFVAIFCLNLFLSFTGILNRQFLALAAKFLPELPAWVSRLFHVGSSLVAEAVFLYMALGVIWTQQRTRFQRWGSSEG